MFAVRVQVDLVTSATAVEVFHRIRSINASAAIVSCSRGNIDPAELEGLQTFDRLVRYFLSTNPPGIRFLRADRSGIWGQKSNDQYNTQEITKGLQSTSTSEYQFSFWYPGDSRGLSHFSFGYHCNPPGLGHFSFWYPGDSRGLSNFSFWYPGDSRGLKSFQLLVSLGFESTP